MRRSCSVSLQLLLFFLTGWATGVLSYSIYETRALINAVRTGDLEEVQRLAKCRCADFQHDDVELDAPGKGNLLHLAVQAQNSEIVEIVLLSGINPNLYSSKGLSAIHYAASKSSVAIVELLLEYGADPNIRSDNDYGHTPLFTAAFFDQAAVIEVLLDAGVDIDQPTLKKTTALGHALYFGIMNAARFLLEAGANPMPMKGIRCNLSNAWICPCRRDFSCVQFTCSREDVRLLKKLVDEACASKQSKDEKPSKSQEEEPREESGAPSISKTDEEQPDKESGVPSQIDKLKGLLEIESDK